MYELNKFHPSVPFEEYKKSEGINASGLKLIKKSPLHFHYSRTAEEKEPTEAMAFGTMFHDLLLLREEYRSRLFVEPEVNRRTNAGKEELVQWRAGLPVGAYIVPSKHEAQLSGMINSALSHPFVSNLLRTGIPEASMWWKDEEFDVLCKGRVDFISSDKYLVDLKTTIDAEPSEFIRKAFGDDLFYPLQVAHYCRGAKAMNSNVNHQNFLLVAIEKTPPYAISVNHCDDGFINYGDDWQRYLLKKYVECVKSGKWPGYSVKAVTAALPQWLKLPEELVI